MIFRNLKEKQLIEDGNKGITWNKYKNDNITRIYLGLMALRVIKYNIIINDIGKCILIIKNYTEQFDNRLV